MPIRGSVTFKGGGAIPAGEIAIYIEDLAIQQSTQRRLAETHVTSDGGSRTIDFFFPADIGVPASSSLRIVARLKRGDGWLLARGSSQFAESTPISVTLNAAVY
jgi:hypothetical protein